MTSSYDWYVQRCKAPKKPQKVKKVVSYLLTGIRKEYPTAYMADRLNRYGVWTLMGRSWTANSLQMQLLKMHRLDEDSSLAWGLVDALRKGDASQEDLELLASRVRH